MGLFKKSNVSKDLINLVSAADGGDKSAAIKIAELSRDGHVTVPEICEARIIIYEPAAKRGDKEARYWVGFSLQTLDPPASFKWLVDLAREGDTRAMKALGSGFSVLAYYGEDEEKELYWYLEAAKLGDAEAQCDAGREYYLGPPEQPTTTLTRPKSKRNSAQRQPAAFMAKIAMAASVCEVSSR